MNLPDKILNKMVKKVVPGRRICRFVKHVGRYSNEGKGWASNTVKGA